MLKTIRLMVAEQLLAFAVAIVPVDHPDSIRLVKAVRDYLAEARRPGGR
jgi:hypothetical protein